MPSRTTTKSIAGSPASTLLGAAGVNILAAQLSQDADGVGATVMLRIDRQVSADVLAAIGTDVGAVTLEEVDLS